MEETGDWTGAQRGLEILTQAFPNKVIYLQRYARILTRNKNFDSALEYWRRLASGLKKESDDWYEAKYSVILCLAVTDPARAKPPLVQFLNLYDPPANWKPRFSDLATRLGVN